MTDPGAGVVEAFILASVAFGLALALLSWALERRPYKSIGGSPFVRDSDPVVNGSPFERAEEVAQLREAVESLRAHRLRPMDTSALDSDLGHGRLPRRRALPAGTRGPVDLSRTPTAEERRLGAREVQEGR